MSLNNGRAINRTWKVASVADFNADGQTDILFESTDGHLLLWTMNGTTITHSQQLRGGQPINSAWRVVAPR